MIRTTKFIYHDAQIQFMTEEYQITVEYIRQGDTYHDRYYSLNSTGNEAMEDVKKLWHINNDHLFLEAKDARFFMEVV